jgi:hypothetical protein
MAFIRWKKNKCGVRQAYLVHSYRDKNGKPRHITLAYLGSAGELTPEHIAGLKAKYPDIHIEWDKVKPATPPAAAPVTDISGMSDESLLRSLTSLRRERGITIAEMVERLCKAGLTSIRVKDFTLMLGHDITFQLDRRHYTRLEKQFAKEQWNEVTVEEGPQIAPFARKALCGG